MTSSGAHDRGPVRVGLLRVDGALVALPVDVLREVLPRPERWTPVPTPAPGLVGAMHLRECVLPVLDLGALQGRPREEEAVGVVVLVHEGAALGLLVDGVHDVVDLDPATLQPVRVSPGPGTGPLLFSATFTRPGTDEIGSLLDPSAVVGAPGVLTTRLSRDGHGSPFTAGDGGDGVDGVPDARSAAASALHPAYLVVRCRPAQGAPVLVAVDVADVRTTLPTLQPRPSQLSGDLCVGVTDHGDVRVPVVDPLHLLGLPRAALGVPTQALLVASQRGLLALTFAEALDIVRPDAADLLTPPRGTGRGRAVLSRVARLPVGHVLVLDVAALLADPELSALSALNTATEADAVGAESERAAAAAAAAGVEPVVVFRARGTLTAPLTQVDTVLTFPQDPAPWIGGRSALGAIVTDHDVVPLVDLAERLGRGALDRPRDGVVLVVRNPAGPDEAPSRTGFVVEGLDDIDRPVWTEALAEATAEERFPLVRVGALDAPLLPRVDLLSVVAAVHDPRRAHDLAR